VRPVDAARFVAAWGLGLAVLAVLARLLGETDKVALAQLPAAALATLVLAAVAALVLRSRDVEAVPDASPGAAALGAGLTLAGAGAAVGLWLVLVAAPLVVVGVISLVLETRS
jgi:hypothetical protein